ncbi:hypothetical protein M2137_002555 [Parabacteroides sp. PFB2-10]|uniref:6-bladed beta-propeller n=1 Tax=Parabacteroides sp. PFB2-10 TaxID=1742405 RepID=UPI002476BA1D|nr:6-bladed beta-propeller [Parabacteroides sp. PFB2-10]MDH6313765.1 hypothetical protein [Parabacteroides sp. PFB2-10]MDL2244574.1 6-bladed beta-propeller [Parabacteroides sp. OttesenSCG-928-J18]
MKKVCLSLCCCLLFFSCVEQKPSDSLPKNAIVLTYDKAKTIDFDYSFLFDSVEIVLLDTLHDTLLADYFNVKYAFDRFFVSDKSHQLFVFDRTGKPLLKIDGRGAGPQEYVNLRGFDLSLEDSLICLFTYPPKLMWYDLNGEFKHQTNVESQGFELALFDDNGAVYARNRLDNGEAQLLNYVDLSTGKTETKMLGYPFLNGVLLPTYQRSEAFTRTSSGELLFNDPLSNYIYALADDGVEVKYVLDFGKKNPPQTENIPLMNTSESSIDYIPKHFPVYAYNNCWENERYFFISMRIDEQKEESLLYDKQEKQLYAGYLRNNMFGGSNSFNVMATDEWLLTYIPPEQVAELKYFLESRETEVAKQGSVMEYIDRLDESHGNPVICLYHFRTSTPKMLK